MDFETNSTAIGLLIIAFFLNSACCIYPLLQILNFRKDGKDQSVQYQDLLGAFISMAIWLCESMSSGDFDSILGNFIGFTFCIVCMLSYYYFCSKSINVFQQIAFIICLVYFFSYFPSYILKAICFGNYNYYTLGLLENISQIRSRDSMPPIIPISTMLDYFNTIGWIILGLYLGDLFLIITFLLGFTLHSVIFAFYFYKLYFKVKDI